MKKPTPPTATAPAYSPPPSTEPSRIVEFAPRPVSRTSAELALAKAQELVGPVDRKFRRVTELAGTYRMIHGNAVLPVPLSQRLNADGTENIDAPKTVIARIAPVLNARGDVMGYVGDEVWLNAGDAERMLLADIVEPLDARPSRCGKVFSPPKEIRGNVWARTAGAA